MQNRGPVSFAFCYLRLARANLQEAKRVRAKKKWETEANFSHQFSDTCETEISTIARPTTRDASVIQSFSHIGGQKQERKKKSPSNEASFRSHVALRTK